MDRGVLSRRKQGRDGEATARTEQLSETVCYPSDVDGFESVMSDITRVVDPAIRLPDWPFRALFGFAYFRTFGGVLQGRFEPVVQSLVEAHGDETVSFGVLDPTPDHYREREPSYPVFRVPASDIGETYWKWVSFHQDGPMMGAVIDTADTFVVTGSSGRWAVWAERQWDLGIILSDIEGGPWVTDTGAIFLSAEEALEEWTEFESGPLPDVIRTRFLKNVNEQGPANHPYQARRVRSSRSSARQAQRCRQWRVSRLENG